jgi:hypothetical protein
MWPVYPVSGGIAAGQKLAKLPNRRRSVTAGRREAYRGLELRGTQA